MRLVFVARGQSLRLGSAVTRGMDFADEVIVIGLGEDAEARSLVEEAGGTYIVHDQESHAPLLARTLLDTVGEGDQTVAIGLDEHWKLRNLPHHVALTRAGHDIYIAFKHRSDSEKADVPLTEGEPVTEGSYTYSQADISVMCMTGEGLRVLADCDVNTSPAELPEEMDVRIIELDATPLGRQRESLTSASRFAQFFYWMLESKHPLLLFGIPGITFFVLGFKMAKAVMDIGGPHDTVSLGVALAAFAVTLVGVLSLVASLLLYGIGKQIDKIQVEQG